MVSRADVFENRYHLQGYLEALTAIHIGTGSNAASLDPRLADNGVVRLSRDQRPYLPGSSLKGVCRAWLARVLRGQGLAVCQRECPGAVWEALCPVCQLFGTQGFGGRLFFADAPAETWTHHSTTEIRTGVSVDLDSGRAIPGRLFTIEVVPAGHRFRMEVYAENVDDGDRHHLDMLRQALSEGMIAIGGGSTRGLGRMRLVDVREWMDTVQTLGRLLAPAGVSRARLIALLAATDAEELSWTQVETLYDQAVQRPKEANTDGAVR